MTEPQFLYLTTLGWKTGKQHRIEIWFVQHNEKYYIISELLDCAHWVQKIKHDPTVSFSIGARIFKGTARIVDQEEEFALTTKVSKLMDTKYKWSRGMIVELSPIKN